MGSRRALGFATGLILFALLATVRAAAPAAAAFVERFTPQGAARGVRQVMARFAQPMVTLGDPLLPDPFDIACTTPGSGRWADARNWIYDFDADLPAGERCTFTLKPAVRTVSGATPAAGANRRFEFTTGGPAIIGSHPYEGWRDTDEEQVFLLKLDSAADLTTVRQRAYCAVEGIGEQIPVEVLEGEARAAVLRERASLGYWYYQLLWKSGATSRARVRDESIDAAEAKLLLVKCQRPLPPGSDAQLVWGAGIRTTSGIATTEEQRLAFRIRDAFTARVECTRVNARAGCLPMLPIEVRFNAPVPRALAESIRLTPAKGKAIAPKSEVATNDAALSPTVDAITFAPPFPESRAVRVTLPAGLVDDAGRTLSNAERFPLEVRVDAAPPLAKFNGTFGILEAKEGGVLPVTLRQLGADEAERPARWLRVEPDAARVADWIRRAERASQPRGEYVETSAEERAREDAAALPKLGTDEEDEYGDGSTNRWREDTGDRSIFTDADGASELKLPRAAGKATTEVVGLPLKTPGFYVVEIESRALGRSLLGRETSRYVATTALVTNLSVHFKWGREASLAWVTALDSGAPVAAADVSVIDACTGESRWSGTTDADGLVRIAQGLGEPHENEGCDYAPRRPLMVAARKAGDFSFTLSSWTRGIGPEDFNFRRNWNGNAMRYSTVLDRALFRAGETVSMKHFLRDHAMSGFVVPAGAAGSRRFVVRHLGSGQQYTFDSPIGADGIGTSQWRIPTEARLGDYEVALQRGAREGSVSMARFKVEQFRLPSMRASVNGSAEPLVRPKDATLDLHVAWLSGGGASGLPVRLRTQVVSAPVQVPGYDDYAFGGEPVVEGLVNESDRSLSFESEEEGGEPVSTRTRIVPVTLDGAGGARVHVGELPEVTSPSRLVAELEYPDANGEVLTTGTSVRLVPSRLNVGIRREGWAASNSQLRFRVVTLELDGKPAAGRDVAVTLYRVQRFSFRKRLVGGFYAYETTRETRRLPVSCGGATDASGLVTCEVAPGVTGEILIRAEAKDDDGRIAGATTSAWTYDEDAVWFGGTSGDRMDVLPEQKSYEAGDTARFQVRMPFRQASALVTVEREGVISGFVTRLDASRPVVEVPVTAQQSPNVYVSVLAVRGRVARADAPADSKRRLSRKDEITGRVDLNKPSFRMGMAAIKVGWKPHRLDVRVTSDKPVYRVRERARLQVQVTRADGGALPAGTEIALAGVDAALLGLAPNASWELLSAMMGERPLEVLGSTAQMQVVGRRHYGRKAVAPGGGGGRDPARELFDTLLSWQPRVRLDAQGRATVEVPLNDSLSEFRLVAIASGGASWFGTGAATITTTQDVILQSGLPSLVREGDQFLATVSLRNTTAGPLALEVTGSRTAAGAAAQPLATQRIELAAGQSRDVSWRVVAPVGAREQTFDVRAQPVGRGDAGDRLRVRQQVIAAYPVRTWQATLLQLDGTHTETVARPEAAIAGRGGVEVSLKASLADGLDAVREYMSTYAYTCSEQMLSRAVALNDRAGWDAQMNRLPAFLDRDGLVRYFATEAIPGEDALTAYVLQLAAETGWAIPDATRARMIAGLKGFVDGRIVRRSALPTADLAIRKVAAIDALARHGEAQAAMLGSLAIEPALWPTSAVVDWLDLLGRVQGIARADERTVEAEQVLRTRLNFQGTTMTFSTERSDGLWWLMISGDVNANRLLLTVLDRPGWREDVPRLVRGALSRQQRGRWNTTVANAWGMLAMRRFSATFEKTPVDGSTRIAYGPTVRTVDWTARPVKSEASLPWQEGAGAVTVTQEGGGKPWLMLRATAALPIVKPVSTGYRIVRTIVPVEQKTPGRWTRGDVARVRLQITAQTDMSWVVVDDPVPAGAGILGSGLGGQSQLLRQGEQRGGVAWLAYEERRFDAFRAYYRFVPKGSWTVEYTMRLNNPGTFLLPATRVEAMYAPEQFGELPNATVVVER